MIKLNLLFKLSYLNANFALTTLGYLKPALNTRGRVRQFWQRPGSCRGTRWAPAFDEGLGIGRTGRNSNISEPFHLFTLDNRRIKSGIWFSPFRISSLIHTRSGRRQSFLYCRCKARPNGNLFCWKPGIFVPEQLGTAQWPKARETLWTKKIANAEVVEAQKSGGTVIELLCSQNNNKKQQTQVTVGWLGKDRCDELRKKRSKQKRGRV